MKPKLTDRVIRGLLHMVSNTEAGTDEDLFGYREPKKWGEAKAACLWVRKMREHKESKKAKVKSQGPRTK